MPSSKSKPWYSDNGAAPCSRVTPGIPPFSAFNIYYFGPLQVKWRRGTAKRHGCIFTCLAIRAMHIEITHDLTSDLFIQAVGRFVCRRGPPKELFSDNGSNSTGAEAEVKQALQTWNQERIRDQLRTKGIEWHFSPQAPVTQVVYGNARPNLQGSTCTLSLEIAWLMMRP